jgi:CO/xanthine dehydrogenase Mo-binding subunit
MVRIKGSDRTVGFAEVSRRAHFKSGGPIVAHGSYVFQAGDIDPKQTAAEGMMSLDQIGTYVFGAQVVEVEVDEVTGKTTVLEGWSAHDVGRAVNRKAVEGQIQGGFAMGLGYALLEELVLRDGRVETDSFASYKMPAPADVPAGIHPIIIENPEPTHPFGVKGIGEPPLLGVAPAVANAIEHATGVRVRSLPLTGERVLSGLLADQS